MARFRLWPRASDALPVVKFVQALCKYWWALMGGATFTFLGVYAQTVHMTDKVTIKAVYSIGVVFFVIAVYRAWKEQYDKVFEGQPDFHIQFGGALAHSEHGVTAVFIPMRIINRGAPSAILGFSARYESPDHSQKAQLVVYKERSGENKIHSFRFPNGTVRSFSSADAIFNQAEVPIPRGGYRAGHLPLVIDGHRNRDVTDGKGKIIVTIYDSFEKPYHAEFRGTGDAPMPTFMLGEPLTGENVSRDFTKEWGTAPQVPTNGQPKNREARRREKHRKRK